MYCSSLIIFVNKSNKIKNNFFLLYLLDLFEDIYKYEKGIDGSSLKSANAIVISLQAVLCYIGRSSSNLNHKNVYARFALSQINEGMQQPDNIHSQLHALELLAMFLVHIEHFCYETQGFQQMRWTLPNWKTALGKMAKNVLSVRQARDFSEHLTNETILQYERCDRVKNVTIVLREVITIKNIYALVESTFLDARNFMITKLIYDKG